MELKRLTADNYDELIGLLDYVFGKKNGKETSFEKSLPGMCRRTDEAMGKHVGIFEDGKLVSALGIYPLPCKIFGEEFMFSTVGNVATLPDYEGRGYMSIILDEAMKALERIGADASRLGGVRQRYGRYGYEPAGVKYTFTLTSHNVKHTFKNTPEIEFEKIEKGNEELLSYANSLHESQKIFVKRSADENYFGFFASATAWEATPYVAKKNGEKIGYLSVGKDEVTIAELYAECADDFIEILVAYQKRVQKDVSITLPDYEPQLLSRLTAFCQNVKTEPICSFKIINFEKITNVLMKLKASYTQMPEGEYTVKIEDYGNLTLFSDGKNVGARLTDNAPDVTLSKREATRFLFGYTPASLIAPIPSFVKLWLPLPLYWNLQDRV